MFGLLKKKISDFVSGLTKREEKEAASSPPKQPQAQEEEKIEEIAQSKEGKKEATAEIFDISQPQEKQEAHSAFESIPKIAEQEEKTQEQEKQKYAEFAIAPEKEIEIVPERTQEAEKEIKEIGFASGKLETKNEEEQVSDALSRIEPITPAKEQAPSEEKPLEKVDFAKSAAKEKPPQISTLKKAPSVLQQAMGEVEPKPAILPKKEKPAEIKPMFSQPAQPELKKEEKRGMFSILSDIVHIGHQEKKPEEKKQQPQMQKTEEKPTQIGMPEIAPDNIQPQKQQQEKPKPAFSIPFITPATRKDERKMEVKVGLGSTIKSIFTGEVEIHESDVTDLLSELELALLESDVAYEVSIAIASELKTKLVGMKVKRGEVQSATKNAIKEVIIAVLTSDLQFDLVSRAKELARPVTILFVGPNGAGKTTTMAKIAQMLMNSNMSVVFSASDTFRAAAIEQTEIHGSKLGVRVIKSAYGSDPASVAFDAIAHARSHSIDVVLIDSAGRQDTNVNLLDELKKINRIAKPAIKIYIGESIAGNAIIDQIKAFDAAIGIDGVILTKLDCDAKGGTALSVTRTTGIPILFLGTGQAYGDLMPFSPNFVAEEILT
jgi:fused signal recognition particle receptor